MIHEAETLGITVYLDKKGRVARRNPVAMALMGDDIAGEIYTHKPGMEAVARTQPEYFVDHEERRWRLKDRTLSLVGPKKEELELHLNYERVNADNAIPSEISEEADEELSALFDGLERLSTQRKG